MVRRKPVLPIGQASKEGVDRSAEDGLRDNRDDKEADQTMKISLL